MTRWRPNNRQGAQQWPRRRQCTQSRAEKSPTLKLSSAAAAAANGKDETGSELLSKCQSVFPPPWTNLKTKKKKIFLYFVQKKIAAPSAREADSGNFYSGEKRNTLDWNVWVFLPLFVLFKIFFKESFSGLFTNRQIALSCKFSFVKKKRKKRLIKKFKDWLIQRRFLILCAATVLLQPIGKRKTQFNNKINKDLQQQRRRPSIPHAAAKWHFSNIWKRTTN